MPATTHEKRPLKVRESYVIQVYRASALAIVGYLIAIPLVATRGFFDRWTNASLTSTALLVGRVAAGGMFVVGCLVLLLTSSPSAQEERQLKFCVVLMFLVALFCG